jgi:hypothetical protein
MRDPGSPAQAVVAGAPPYGDAAYVPTVQHLYWLRTTVLPPGDPEDHRAVVVLDAPPSTAGTISVVTRSGAGAPDDTGVDHPADPRLGVSAPGRFVRRHPVQGRLWTPANVTPIGRLDDATFAAVRARFGR